jgi:hypothetical protein
MAEDFYDFDDDRNLQPRGSGGLFWWTLFILLLIGVVAACWLGSFYIFGHPEDPRCYKVLKKLKKIEPPRRFDVTAAPLGEFLSPERLFERYTPQTRLELEKENDELLRIYIKNYTETKKTVPYLRGKFEVIEARELGPQDFIQSGMVALLHSPDYPQLVVEHLFPATGANIEQSKRLLVSGYPFPIERTNDVTAVLRVTRMADGRALATVVPLHYPPYALKGGVGSFATEPPTELNVEAGLPVTKTDALEAALRRFAQSKATEPAVTEKPAVEIKGPEVVRLDTVPLGQKAPESGAIPEPPIARAEPVRPVAPTPRPRTEVAMNNSNLRAATPLPLKPASATPRPLPTAAPVATSPATPPPVVAPSGVPLKPFVQSNPGIVPPSEQGANWRVYPAGTQPPGRNIAANELSALVGQPIGDRIYLSGNFVVTAQGDNKAVFRPRGITTDAPVRILAVYPNGALLPREGEVFARDSSRGFQVTEVSRGDDGTINVQVREITRAP